MNFKYFFNIARNIFAIIGIISVVMALLNKSNIELFTFFKIILAIFIPIIIICVYSIQETE